MKNTIFALLGVFSVCSCATIPQGIEVVNSFDAEKYMGKWYEIARFDFRFEKDLNNVTATYSLNKNGSIKVENRGYNYISKEWKQAIGKAKLSGMAGEAKLKVSFFGPFYAPYNVIALDNEYKYALVIGKNFKYMWILSREKSIPETVKQNYLKIAKDAGFDTSALIWTEHSAS